MLALAVLAAVAAGPSPSWIALTMGDGRGGVDRIEVLSPDGIGGPVAARRTVSFMDGPAKIDWAYGPSCPGLETAIAALKTLRPFETETIVPTEVPRPPPPHRMTVKVQVGAAVLHGIPGSAVGLWTQGLLDGLAPCWRPEPPAP